ncbi:MAG: hypothetical protein WAT09_11880 [Paracoccaceae bacterium]
MIRRSVLPIALLLAACQPSVPDSGAGVGFQDYNSYIRGAYAPAPGAAAAAPAPKAGFDPASASAAIDRADGRATSAAAPTPAGAPLDGTLPAIRPRGSAPAGIKEESGEMAGIAGHSSISDEQDFDAVKQRESIESDKERIARNRDQYVVVQPRDLPVRPGETGPNIVVFALATTHAPGTQMYTRRSLVKKDLLVTCAKYGSPDLAQEEFLAKGGPEKDKLGLDPDGDGFACSWDPRPFRTALQ